MRALIDSQVCGVYDRKSTDRPGNVMYFIDVRPELPTLMVSAHMDEVGMIIRETDDDGFLRFASVGGIDTRVLCGRRITLLHNGEKHCGVISSKPIHLQGKEERKKVTPEDEMYIDIGARSREEPKICRCR